MHVKVGRVLGEGEDVDFAIHVGEQDGFDPFERLASSLGDFLRSSRTSWSDSSQQQRKRALLQLLSMFVTTLNGLVQSWSDFDRIVFEHVRQIRASSKSQAKSTNSREDSLLKSQIQSSMMSSKETEMYTLILFALMLSPGAKSPSGKKRDKTRRGPCARMSH